MSSTGEFRGRHHYALVHCLMRELAFDNPYLFFASMLEHQESGLLERLWIYLCEENEGVPGFSIRDIHIHLVRVVQYPALLILMPPPQRMTEAHMVCFVLKVARESVLQETPVLEIPEVEYFTLEKTETEDGDPHATCLCSWHGSCHLNYGQGPRSNEGPQAFLRAVERLIDLPVEERPILGFHIR